MSKQRTVGDLADDSIVWIASTTRVCAHLDRHCNRFSSEPKPRSPRELHPSLRLCNICDDEYVVDRASRKGLARKIREGDT